MTRNILRRCQSAALASGLALSPLAAQAASVGVHLAPSLTPQEIEAVYRQIAVTIEGSVKSISPSTGIVDDTTDARPPRYLPLNHDADQALASWAEQLHLERERSMPRRPVLVLIRNGQVEAGWVWRDDIPLETAPLLSRSSLEGPIESQAALGEFFRHAYRLDRDALRWLPVHWPGTDRDGWHILRHRVMPGQPAFERSPSSASDPWDFR